MAMSGPSSPGTVADPSASQPKMLVLCFDGTANEFDEENTNVVKFFAMLRKDCDSEQLCYYQTGVGTYEAEAPGLLTPLTMWVAKILDEAFAFYLDAHVMGGYKFLMQNYHPGDKISIFGFSRGAYTARALAGMLTKIGLLPRGNIEQVTFAYKLYKRSDQEGITLAAGFKSTFCRSVIVDFLGVWETVASTGVIMSKNLPFTTNNKLIKTFRHALSLDERRAKFVPTFWHTTTPKSHGFPFLRDSAVPLTVAEQNRDPPRSDIPLTEQNGIKKLKKKHNTWSIFAKGKEDLALNAEDEESESDTCDVKEVWFCGWHSDVGGGDVKNNVSSSLADIPLRWMIREVAASQCGIQFDAAMMARLNVHVCLPAPIYFAPATSAVNGEDPGPQPSAKDATSDATDAQQPLHNELRAKPLWWILEVIPLPFTWQDAAGAWHERWEFHMGRGRYVNTSGPLLFHETVKMRMADTAKYVKGKEEYVW
ncbi:hypothetical protein DFH11DRAFT_1594792 [Phellopilus nigrolimitatus]|nr:hypothetical protein DFH11DRAFT_1594792 [Phellopilus nigrolimitatus]